ncbi:class I ribonucleotide reductase maintenance protein YfaE [Echinimonas agarilytica]|uniref:Class I ribonucleotide reductase maintenance protein YfaE n=1 Tax=Echinimonas agarilytica TaxID=1215918 RepID=A0AA41WA46_9GAMM|nr:class I ribonucleotide reductase maintenance protein YfaE [Echinimonas agarilytica]
MSKEQDNQAPWVFVQGQQAFKFDASQHDSLLQALEEHGVDVHYECRAGFCGSCRTSILDGSVKYSTQPIAFFRQGEILPCCCVPTSDITLDE